VARAPVRIAGPPARAVRELFLYWRAERRTVWQGYVGLWISSAGDLLAGLGLAFMTNRLQELPSLFILVPAAIGMRGNIFGAMGSRFGTAIHAGTFRVTRAREGVLYQNAYAAILLSLVTSAYLAVGARIVSAATGLASISVWDFLVISIVAGVGSGVVILGLTILLSRVTYARNWDLDSVAGPVVTFMGDVVTLPSLFAASYLARAHLVTLGIGAAVTAVALWALVEALRTHLPIARRILRESIVVLAIAGFIDLVAGAVVEHRINHFLTLPALLILIPPFLEDAGALGSIVSARLASKLHLGSVRPSLVPERLALLDISLLAPWALSVFTLVGISAHLISRLAGKPSPGLLAMVGVSLLAGYLATVGAAIISYATAVATYRFGLDPDNHGIPILTSSMDLVGMICLVGTVVLLRVT
jgi:mgtE-like transporter